MKFLDLNGLAYFYAKIKARLLTKVDKVNGKGLSTNDYTTAEKTKLFGIADKANNYAHPAHPAKAAGLYKITTNNLGHVTAAAAVVKGDIMALGIPAQDTNTVYDNATINVSGLMSSFDKIKLDGVAYRANAYAHPITSGNKHVPGGGAAGQFLKWSADGTAVWGVDNNTTYGIATPSVSGLMSGADKTKLDSVEDGMLNKTLTHTKAGIVHALTGGIPTKGLIVATFKAMAEFVEGDTFTINGIAYTAKPNGEETALPGKVFVVGDLVNVTVDISGKKLGFKLGGGGDKPKITVSLTAPANPIEGDFWIEDSGYVIDSMVADINAPETLSKNALFLCTTETKSSTFKIINNDNYDIRTYLNHAAPYVAGERVLCEVYIYSNDAWVRIGPNSNKIFQMRYNTQTGSATLYEVNLNTFSIIRQGPSDGGSHSEGMAGTINRLFQLGSCDSSGGDMYEWDTKVLLKIKTARYPIPGDANPAMNICGMSTSIYHLNSSTDAWLYELNCETFGVVRNLRTVQSFSIGGTNDSLYTKGGGTIFIIDSVTGSAILQKEASFLKYSSEDMDGTRNRLFTADYDGTVNNYSWMCEIDAETLVQINISSVVTYKTDFSIGCTK